jgi:cation diffusion facilitator family transporter
MNKKAKAAGISIVSNTTLILLKLIVGLISGSVSIISEAIHSSMDLLASVIAFFAVQISAKKPDSKHPFGHGKFENISGVLEGILILIAAFWIIYEAIHKLAKPEAVSNHEIAILVMLISSVLNFFVSRHLFKVAKETNSIALEADALHLKTDVYTSLGVGLGIVVIWISGWSIFDPIFAILVALLILKESYHLISKAFDPLLDSRIAQNEIDIFNTIIIHNLPENTSYSDLRIRLNGHIFILDFVLKVPESMSVKQAHAICDQLETDIQRTFDGADIKIHIEPHQE